MHDLFEGITMAVGVAFMAAPNRFARANASFYHFVTGQKVDALTQSFSAYVHQAIGVLAVVSGLVLAYIPPAHPAAWRLIGSIGGIVAAIAALLPFRKTRLGKLIGIAGGLFAIVCTSVLPN